MLVIDDYNELEFLENLLRRLGFDVLSLSKDVSVSSSILGFFPDLVVAQAKSRSVDGLAMSPKIKKVAPQSKIVLLHPFNQIPKLTIENRNAIDGFLVTPVETVELVRMLSNIGNQDANFLNEKLSRIAAGMSEEKRIRLQGKKPAAQASDDVRVSGKQQSQSDIVHVSGTAAKQTPGNTNASGSVGGAEQFTKGVHHIHGTNTLKGSTHISGERQEGGPAYDPSGSQAKAKSGLGYMPDQQESAKGAASGNYVPDSSNSSDRSQRYNEFLATHKEPVDKVLTQAELRKRAKDLKLDQQAREEDELEAKREFVRALFRK